MSAEQQRLLAETGAFNSLGNAALNESMKSGNFNRFKSAWMQRQSMSPAEAAAANARYKAAENAKLKREGRRSETLRAAANRFNAEVSARSNAVAAKKAMEREGREQQRQQRHQQQQQQQQQAPSSAWRGHSAAAEGSNWRSAAAAAAPAAAAAWRPPAGKVMRECKTSNVGHLHPTSGQPCKFVHKDEEAFAHLRPEQKRGGRSRGSRKSSRGSRKSRRASRKSSRGSRRGGGNIKVVSSPAPLSKVNTYTSWPGGIDPTVPLYNQRTMLGGLRRTRRMR